MNNNRNTAIVVGVLYIIGTVAGILSVFVVGGLLTAPDYLNQIALNANRVMAGALLLLVMAIVLALVPVLLFPVLREKNEVLAIGYVVFRGALETLTGIGIVVCWLLLVVVAREANSGAALQFQAFGTLLLRAQDPIFSNVSGIFFSLGALMLYYLLYQTRLILRWISAWGLLAAVLTLTANLSAIFSVNLDFLKYVMLPQEMVMAVWLIVKGFNPSAIGSGASKGDAYPRAKEWTPISKRPEF